ncbi:MAG: LptE family protein [Bacteroidota bacterium]|nr:LPS assembly lipoprotein LptE [Candidatus Kapabacteria bacterium]MDW8219807.1 LptE family protein [Bacteroidota bacterium]
MKTLYIPLADDKSIGGSSQMRERLTQLLIEAFRRENAFQLVQGNADAVLEATITGISETIATVQTGEQERDKQLTISVNVVYYDRVKQKQIWVKQFAPPQTYSIASGLQGREGAIDRALRQIASDILLQVVSGW